MTIETTRGIVLRNKPYKETGALVTIYSYDFGKITLSARGVQSLKSKNRPSLLPITSATYDINLRVGLSTLIKGQPLDYYHEIKKTIETEIVAQLLCEYYYRYIEDNKPSLEHFDFLETALKKLNEGYSYYLIYLLILVFIMKDNGVHLTVDHCVLCESTKVIDFSIDDGGFVCVNHGHHPSSPEYLKTIRHLYKTDIHHIDQLHIPTDLLKKVIPVFEYYVEEICGIRLKSQIYLNEIIK